MVCHAVGRARFGGRCEPGRPGQDCHSAIAVHDFCGGDRQSFAPVQHGARRDQFDAIEGTARMKLILISSVLQPVPWSAVVCTAAAAADFARSVKTPPYTVPHSFRNQGLAGSVKTTRPRSASEAGQSSRCKWLRAE